MEAKLNDSLVGQVLDGRYEIQSKLGEGSMGKVYEAHDQILGRRTAVKVLRPEVFSDADARRRFLREAKLAASINHQNAVIVHDYKETESGVTFLVMEYIEGQSLGELLKKEGHLSPARVVNIVQQVAAALDAAHQLGVIHRDLKPDNIMVMEGDRVKVVDFGIAKALDGREGLGTITQTGGVIGTPLYMSPEQFAARRLDARSDVYSLALVTYEMLTGTQAFAAGSLPSLMAARLSRPPLPMSAAAPNIKVPIRVEAVVQQALAQQPEDRPASAGAFAMQLTSGHLGLLDAQSVSDVLEQVNSLLAAGHFELALELVNEVLAKNPTSPELRTKKVEVMVSKVGVMVSQASPSEISEIIEAIKLIVTVVDEHPNYGPAYYCIGILKEYEGQVPLAIASYKHCLDLKPSPEYVWKANTNLLRIYSKLYYDSKLRASWLLRAMEMKAKTAIAVASRKSLEIFPRLILTQVYIDDGKYALAREQLEMLLQDNAFRDEKEQAMVYYRLALVASSEKKYDEAIKAAERVAQLDPKNKDYQKLIRDLRDSVQDLQDGQDLQETR